jgi:hypothetical protein
VRKEGRVFRGSEEKNHKGCKQRGEFYKPRERRRCPQIGPDMVDVFETESEREKAEKYKDVPPHFGRGKEEIIHSS